MACAALKNASACGASTARFNAEIQPIIGGTKWTRATGAEVPLSSRAAHR